MKNKQKQVIEDCLVLKEFITEIKSIEENSDRINFLFDDLLTKVENLEKEPSNSKETIDVAIMTAIDKELEMVKLVFGIDENVPYKETNEKIPVWKTSITSNKLNKELSVIVANIGEAGNIPSTIITRDIIYNFDIKLFVFIGIAAGPKDDVDINDVVIADSVFNYEKMKITTENTYYRERHKSVQDFLKRNYRNFNYDEKMIIIEKEIKDYYNLIGKEKRPIVDGKALRYSKKLLPSKIHKDKIIISGEKLSADGSLNDYLKNDYSKISDQIRALEMEGSGFSESCEKTNIPWLVFRGISDNGDEDKSKYKSWQYLVAMSTAVIAKEFLTGYYDPI